MLHFPFSECPMPLESESLFGSETFWKVVEIDSHSYIWVFLANCFCKNENNSKNFLLISCAPLQHLSVFFFFLNKLIGHLLPTFRKKKFFSLPLPILICYLTVLHFPMGNALWQCLLSWKWETWLSIVTCCIVLLPWYPKSWHLFFSS